MQGFLQGYTLTGRTGLFPSYEAFLGIIHTMMVQYAKFMKMVSWVLFVSILFFIVSEGCRNSLEARLCLLELSRNVNMDSPGAQRVFSSESVSILTS